MDFKEIEDVERWFDYLLSDEPGAKACMIHDVKKDMAKLLVSVREFLNRERK